MASNGCMAWKMSEDMPRHHAILVHKQISAQLQAGLLKQAPRSYPALVNYPPNPTPTQDPLSSHRSRNMQPILFPIRDRLRKAFFRDHPFEAYRPVSLLELDPQQLAQKTSYSSNPQHLYQISPNPSPEELRSLSLISHILPVSSTSKTETMGLCIWYNLNQAYKVAVSEFRTLRFEAEIRASFARQEAEYLSRPMEEEGEAESQVWGRDLMRRAVQIQDRFILNSCPNSSRKSNHPSPSPSTTHLNLPTSNRLIQPRTSNLALLSIQIPAPLNLAINAELRKKSARLSRLPSSSS
ncbi:hypothetical protein VP01_802g3 [Puccinia sorghi]|uniref:Small ribosomal subunit protein mS23 n=1 Tax=Puccinia sorghi TaxID=27349 RepID=A0A0L6UAD9_9BASI|nr:hypothetical protein VP01_802g3 [Puccinia sorghi]